MPSSPLFFLLLRSWYRYIHPFKERRGRIQPYFEENRVFMAEVPLSPFSFSFFLSFFQQIKKYGKEEGTF